MTPIQYTEKEREIAKLRAEVERLTGELRGLQNTANYNREECLDALAKASTAENQLAQALLDIADLKRQPAGARKDTERIDKLEQYIRSGWDVGAQTAFVNRGLETLRQVIDAIPDKDAALEADHAE